MNKSTVNPWIVAIVVSLATFMEVLDTTITNVSLSHIAGSLGSSQIEASWVITSYLVANAIILPLSGWLASGLGRKRYFMISIGLFTFFSFLCGTAQTLSALIIFRILQGIGGGGLQSIQQAIVLDAFPPDQRGVVFGISGVTLIFAPIIGPTLGGWITDTYTWHWIFLINIPVGLSTLILIQFIVSDPPHAQSKGFSHIDWIGLILIIIGIGSLQIMLDQGQQKDWFNSHFIFMLGIMSFCFLIAAIFWLLKQDNPIVNIRLLKDRSFSIGCSLIFVVGFLLYSSTTLLPVLLQSLFGYTATLSGLVITPGGLSVLILMPLCGKLVQYIHARVLARIGLIMIAIGLFLTHNLTPELNYEYFVLLRITQVIGIPFLFIPVSALAYQHIAQEDNNKASGIFALARNLGGSFGIALTWTYFQQQQQIQFHELVEHINPYNPLLQEGIVTIQQRLMELGIPTIRASEQSLALIYKKLIYQANLLSYENTFLILSGFSLLATLLTFYAPKNATIDGKNHPISHDSH
ncbi:DHA2 family efflux MFS transporter permease subunit [bacterium]|nr:DHA2 family efflux MFS transporter permease subunit [bacterium]NBW57036.1 DHA2 family efflux MFS transporter permease subunit [bacterium]NBX72657.1 DHA2 family efflux MFS transporter permease subunit [bacterium]